MLNIYRVISLSLVTALFFAAPLLCVHPISTQMKKAEQRQNKRVRVVSQRATHNPRIFNRNVSAAWTQSIHRREHKTLHLEPSLPIRDGDASLNDNYGIGWKAAKESEGLRTIEAASYSDL